MFTLLSDIVIPSYKTALIGTEIQGIFSVVLALVLGFAIGFERKLRFKEAGIRTHTIVCFGAALMMVVSKFGFDGQEADVSRVAAQIVSGVGFLGAGIIMFRGQKMHGLTTAAGIWATAGVGMACGAGLYIFASVGAVLLIAVQSILHLNIKIFKMKKYYQIKICFINVDNSSQKIKQMFLVDKFNSLKIEREDNGTVYHAMLNTDKEFSSTVLNEIMEQNPFILSIERCDDV